ncbi:hypothetical protein Q31a_36780 [Aureliella helgolandensis]|uniref:Uncharacterized protein n=1 Tax=Aureliella helgolandensis TaxID=2527968 RepID=A0A518G9V6_9BACT|nr:hypothetical protein Q31a_36780 [Aureliella helgolandensis]
MAPAKKNASMLARRIAANTQYARYGLTMNAVHGLLRAPEPGGRTMGLKRGMQPVSAKRMKKGYPANWLPHPLCVLHIVKTVAGIPWRFRSLGQA